MAFNLLIFIFTLFCLSLYGIIFNYKNLIITIIMLEILLFSVILNLILFSVILKNLYMYFFVLLLLGIAAAETTIGLSLIVFFFKYNKEISVDLKDQSI